MVTLWGILGVPIVFACLAAVFIWRPMRKSLREARFARERREFHRQRERLEARFLQLAANSGRAPHLRWNDCEFSNDVTYARDRRTGRLCAFVGVTIACDQPTAGGLLDNPYQEDYGSTAQLREATAVFHYDKGRWHTLGRTVFNLNPDEALQRYKDDFVMLGQELARHR
ncbi:MAG: hypothetical protein K1X74_11220 [Pirellulales bacterium]|nr:hypothetical protein [Pirellulales bacterium]